MIRKRLWFNAPDKLENWLEEMESQGYNLQRISKRGINFYFKKGHPRKMSYCVDYQTTAKRTYFDMHTEAGWQPMFSSGSSLFKWTIWSQVYEEGEERPQIYTDRKNRLKQARRVMVNNTLLSFPMLFLIYLMLTMNGYFSFDMSLFRWIILLIYLFGITFSLIEMIRTMLFYRRVKNSK